MIKACKCVHEYQDSVHGKGMRAHTTDKEGNPRCTVCSGPSRCLKRVELHGSAHEKAKHG